MFPSSFYREPFEQISYQKQLFKYELSNKIVKRMNKLAFELLGKFTNFYHSSQIYYITLPPIVLLRNKLEGRKPFRSLQFAAIAKKFLKPRNT